MSIRRIFKLILSSFLLYIFCVISGKVMGLFIMGPFANSDNIELYLPDGFTKGLEFVHEHQLFLMKNCSLKSFFGICIMFSACVLMIICSVILKTYDESKDDKNYSSAGVLLVLTVVEGFLYSFLFYIRWDIEIHIIRYCLRAICSMIIIWILSFPLYILNRGKIVIIANLVITMVIGFYSFYTLYPMVLLIICVEVVPMWLEMNEFRLIKDKEVYNETSSKKDIPPNSFETSMSYQFPNTDK